MSDGVARGPARRRRRRRIQRSASIHLWRALRCWQSLRSTWRTAWDPHLRRRIATAPFGVIVSAAILWGFPEAIPGELVHTTASLRIYIYCARGPGTGP